MVQAGRLIAQALAYEGSGDYEEAFDLYKAGVDLLLNGVQSKFAYILRGCICTCNTRLLHLEFLWVGGFQAKNGEVSSVLCDIC